MRLSAGQRLMTNWLPCLDSCPLKGTHWRWKYFPDFCSAEGHTGKGALAFNLGAPKTPDLF